MRISQEALEDIIDVSARQISGVRDVLSKLRSKEQALEITISCQFEQGILIPESSERLKETVKQDVERYTGIPVTEVKVLVRRLDKAPLTARVR